MTATSGDDDLFSYRKPKIGRARGGVTIDRSRTITVEHPLVKQPASTKVDHIAYVVRVDVDDDDDSRPLFLAGDPRFLTVGPAPNVAIVFRPPLRFARFKFGADRGLPITGRERRRGLDCDVLLLPMDDGRGLVDRLTRAGAPTTSTLNDALSSTFGLAVGHDLEQQRVALRRTKRWVAAWMAFSALLFIGLSMGFVLGPRQASTATWIRGAAASIGTFLISISLMALLYSSGSSRRKKLLAALCMVTSLLAFGGVRLFGGSPLLVGPTLILLSCCGAAVAGLPVGILRAVMPRLGSSEVEQAATGDTVGDMKVESASRRLRYILAIVIGVVMFTVAALTQPGSMADMRIATAVVRSIDDGIPVGWVRIAGSPFVADFAGHPCADGIPPHTAASRRRFGWPLVGPELPLNNAEAEVTVLMARDVEAARAEIAHLSDPAYEPCSGDLAMDAVAGNRSLAPGGTITPEHQGRTEIDAGGIERGSGAIDTFQVRISDANGNLTGSAVVGRAQIGRAVVEVLAHNLSDMTFDPTELETFVDAVIDDAQAELA